MARASRGAGAGAAREMPAEARRVVMVNKENCIFLLCISYVSRCRFGDVQLVIENIQIALRLRRITDITKGNS